MEGQLTDEQLRILKSKLEVLTRIHAEIGLLESKKHELLHNAVAAKTKLQDYQKSYKKNTVMYQLILMTAPFQNQNKSF